MLLVVRRWWWCCNRSSSCSCIVPHRAPSPPNRTIKRPPRGAGIIGGGVYNVIVGKEEVTPSMQMQLNQFGRMTQCFSVTADIVTIIMILDEVLQDIPRSPLHVLRCGGPSSRPLRSWQSCAGVP